MTEYFFQKENIAIKMPWLTGEKKRTRMGIASISLVIVIRRNTFWTKMIPFITQMNIDPRYLLKVTLF